MFPLLLAWQPLAAAQPTPPGLRIEGVVPTAYEVRLVLDPDAERFRGVMTAHLSLEGRQDVIWLNAHGLDIETAHLRAGRRARPLTVVEGDEEHVGFAPKRPAKGDVVLEIAYTGLVERRTSVGVFAQEEAGDHYLLTQFESTDARRAFPCVDDPQFKVPWTLTLDVPEGLGAYANTPVVEETAADGRKLVAFAPSRPLPSYLVAFATGPFDEVDAGTVGRDDTPIRIVVARGRAGDASWAAESTPIVLETLEEYFDQPYPYAKLDVVTIPQAVGFGAMENAGLVTFSQNRVLARPEDDTEQHRRRFAEIQAHEVGHQWFGDLVTPRWWDDLWLNESFASWIATRTLQIRWPEWNAGRDRVGARIEAMAADGLVTARQIREPIVVMDDIDGAFDAITYEKGQSVLVMMEAWLGADRFRDGVRAYLTEHAWGSATADDFLKALGAAADRDVVSPMRTFLDQPGVPLVTFEVDCGEQPALTLSQSRFLASGETDDSLWQIPVCARIDGERTCVLLDEREARVPLPRCPASLVPNDGYTGYYRSDLGADATRALLASADLDVEERLALIDDARALVAIGRLPADTLLAQVPAFAASPDPDVVAAGAEILESIDARLVPDALRSRYAAFVQRTYGPVAKRLGWDPLEGEPQEVTELRPVVIRLVGDEGEDAAIRKEARRRVDRWLAERDGTDPTMISSAFSLAAIDGDRALFDAITAQGLAEPDRQRRRTLLRAASRFERLELVTDVMNLSGHPKLNLRERAPLLREPLGRPSTQDAAWGWLSDHIDGIEQALPESVQHRLLGLASGFCSAEDRARAETLLSERAERYPGGRRAFATALEEIDLCTAMVAREAEAVAAFLREQPTRRRR